MFTTLQKYAPIISILLLIALLVALLFYPDSSRGLSMGILIFSIGTAIIFIFHRNWQEHNPSTGSGQEHSENTLTEFLLNTALDMIGLALTMIAAIWLGRTSITLSAGLTGDYAGMAVGSRAGQLWSMGRTSTTLSTGVWGLVRG
ncbi:MAG: hypothetical protein HQ525_01780 [Anaerolineae bacterium]|nr:hypothetical protein [Anaerolineae bacterium]